MFGSFFAICKDQSLDFRNSKNCFGPFASLPQAFGSQGANASGYFRAVVPTIYHFEPRLYSASAAIYHISTARSQPQSQTQCWHRCEVFMGLSDLRDRETETRRMVITIIISMMLLLIVAGYLNCFGAHTRATRRGMWFGVCCVKHLFSLRFT